MTSLQSIYDIDFGQLYKDHKQQSGRPRSAAGKWDQRAQAIQVGGLETPYTQAFISAMELNPEDTLLDVGCGSGAIAVLAAPFVKKVYGLDYSSGMLERLHANAHHYNTHNVISLCKDWEESWLEVPKCDVVVASRSTLVEDMEHALLKLTAQAKRHVYITYPAQIGFGTQTGVDWRVDPQLATPSYFYILAILHQLGIKARLQFIRNDQPSVGLYSNPDWALIDWAL